MSRRRERRFSSAHAIAIAALFFALGGGAYAAVSSLPANSVGTKQLKNHSVTPVKLSRNAAGGPHTLTRKEKKELVKLLKRFATRGPVGPMGPKGDQGSPGPSDVYIGGAGGGSLTGSYAAVASTSVPAGEYLIQAKTVVFTGTPGDGGAAGCEIVPSLGAGGWDAASITLPGIPAQINSGNLSLAGAASLPNGSAIVLACKSNSGSLAVDDARVWATRVGSLHGLPVPID